MLETHKILFTFPIPFSDLTFGVGYKVDWYIIRHTLIYMAIVWPGFYLWRQVIKGICRLAGSAESVNDKMLAMFSLFGSWLATTFVELHQGVQYTYDPGNFFGLFDWISSLFFAGIVFKKLYRKVSSQQ